MPAGPGTPRAAAQAGGGAVGGEVEYDPPVDAPVTDPFRPPAQPWLPGNRGIEYATTPGTPVRAAGDGRVTFAGPVAGALHVTIAHADGVRTSYSFLATVAVTAGSEVRRGHVLGTAGSRLHIGARRGEAYIDPASLWGAVGPPWVRLAPLDGRRSPALPRVGGGRAVAIYTRPSALAPRQEPTSPHSPVHQRSPRGVRTG